MEDVHLLGVEGSRLWWKPGANRKEEEVRAGSAAAFSSGAVPLAMYLGKWLRRPIGLKFFSLRKRPFLPILASICMVWLCGGL